MVNVGQSGPPQATSGSQKRQRFQQIGFARTIWPKQHHGTGIRLYFGRPVVAKTIYRQPFNLWPRGEQ
jgi:hypothetical protein